MEKFARFVVEQRRFFLILFTVVTVISLLLVPLTKVNYDNTKYLPEDMETKKAITVMEEEFGLQGSAQVMFSGVDIPDVLQFKKQMKEITGVTSVIWLDDVADVTVPMSFMDESTVKEYYKDGKALLQVTFQDDDHSLATGEALEKIRELAPEKISIIGPAMNALSTRTMTSSEIFKITLFVVPIILLILILFTNSWFEPILFLTVIGVSVLINMGTNLFVGEISYITRSSAALLQLAIAMDYSIFLLHRFGEERAKGLNVVEAMTQALTFSFTSIMASSLTTVAGFVALMFMRYQIGFDMGLVLAKGIVLSLLSVLLLMPALTILFEGVIERTHHRSFMPSLGGFAKGIMKLRYILPLLITMVLVPAFLAQSANQFLYGDAVTATSEGTRPAIEKKEIQDTFGQLNRVILLVPKGNITNEVALVKELDKITYVKSTQALVTLADPLIPRSILPDNIINNFESENYARMIVTLNTDTESKTAFDTIAQIREAAQELYPDQYLLLGSSASIIDIKTVVEYDFLTVNLISILAVSLILLFTFRSLTLPLLLVFVIESSIWINMSVPYFMGAPLIFIGYMIVGAIQLGATIDYAILLTGRYMENRRVMGKHEASQKAISDAGNSIITSAGILCVSGFMLGFMSNVSVISSLGMLIGRGALLSGLMVLIFLPQLLVLFDGLIARTTLNPDFFDKEDSFELKGAN